MKMLKLGKNNFAKFSVLSRFSSTALASSVNRESVKEPKIQQLVNGDIKSNYPVPVFKRALIHNKSIGLKDQNGEFSYLELVGGSQKLSKQISDICGKYKNVLMSKVLINNDLVSLRKTNKLPNRISWSQ